MKKYLIKVGKNAKHASNIKVDLHIKNKVIIKYSQFINKNKKKFLKKIKKILNLPKIKIYLNI